MSPALLKFEAPPTMKRLRTILLFVTWSPLLVAGFIAGACYEVRRIRRLARARK